ncbi:FAD-dependent oxidoreductase [Geodermatophilus ruber]|uniref:NADPH-dependent 2,4-dienoyl-CoA reductase, sulfur reductase n=1 Tax=Geodermatophilus ruber TaxID=504800 RepID=A0A1I3Z566_9ACTN|nr:FAD-dependent oxidoreductase [Geodermatophilus ruber]SFK39117.1 NADPH-dependent 2,4-dienoyl-CoA reductase, sulfur reductase [Geodermatophilus ruber]
MSADRLVVIGGDAAGMSAAAQARRLRAASDLAITVLEQGPEVSYSACGIPYWVGGQVPDRDRLIARTPSQFAAQQIDVRTGTRAEAIDLDAGTVRTSAGETLGYDSLVVATGGRPLRPPVPGLDAEGVHGVHRLADGADIRAAIAAGARRVVVLGGGYIGLEMADVLHQRGLSVTVVLADPLPMGQLDADMGERVCKAMGDMGIDVQPNQPVREIETDADGVVRAVRTDAGSYPCDLVVLGLGMGPEVALAREAGLRLGETGAVEVDRSQRSRSHPEVFAAGDCAQTFSRITGEAQYVPLGTHANKQGRVAGSVIGGRAAHFAGVLGTAVTTVGGLEIGRTGLCTSQAEQAGYDFRSETIEGTTRAGYYPGAEQIAVKLITEHGSGLLLGAQIVGGAGSGKRIDILATAIWAGMTAEEFAGSDISYAPPFSPTYDPVLVAARVVSRVEQG